MESGRRLKIQLPGGAQFEAEGSEEFVLRERQEFLRLIQGAITPSQATPESLLQNIPNIAWEGITETHGRDILLRGKLAGNRSEKDACLVLLAASQKLLSQPKPTATQLAKWLRSSGYPIQRMDRALQDGVTKGEILSSGSRRARRYELTAPGRLRAHILANQLTGVITGRI